MNFLQRLSFQDNNSDEEMGNTAHSAISEDSTSSLPNPQDSILDITQQDRAPKRRKVCLVRVSLAILLAALAITLAVAGRTLRKASPQATSPALAESGPVWVQLGSDIDGPKEKKVAFGFGIAMSRDGKRVAVGAPFYTTIDLVDLTSTTTHAVARGGSSPLSVVGLVQVLKLTRRGSWKKVGNAILGGDNQNYAGHSVALSANGKTVAVASTMEDGGGGSIRIYEETKEDGLWVPKGDTLTARIMNDVYSSTGEVVCISDDGNIVALIEDAIDNFVVVYKYHHTKKIWEQIGNDLDANANPRQHGERSIALSSDGKRIAISWPRARMTASKGTVRVFEYNGDQGDWIQLGNDFVPGGPLEFFGNGLAISGDGKRIAASSYDSDGTNGKGSDRIGRVEVYEYIDAKEEWNKLGMDIYGSATNEMTGKSISMSYAGDRIAIGAIHHDGKNGSDSGHVRVFQYGTVSTDPISKWTQIGGDIHGESAYDLSGWAVALSGDGSHLAVGAPYNDSNGGRDNGHVRIFNLQEQ